MFNLTSQNSASAGITTDGAHIWVVNNKEATDEVFKYTMTGQLVGSWQIDTVNSTPTGITIDPNHVGHVWIVDSGTDRVYQYDDGAKLASGSATASSSFALAENNMDPQGLADPRPRSDLGSRVSAETAEAPQTPIAALGLARRQNLAASRLGGRTDRLSAAWNDEALEELTRDEIPSPLTSVADDFVQQRQPASHPAPFERHTASDGADQILADVLDDLFGQTTQDNEAWLRNI